jgi:hypothetical protein
MGKVTMQSYRIRVKKTTLQRLIIDSYTRWPRRLLLATTPFARWSIGPTAFRIDSEVGIHQSGIILNFQEVTKQKFIK